MSVASTRLERNKRLRQNPIRRLASRRQDIVKPPYNPATDLDGLRTALLMLMSFGGEAIGHASPPAGDEFLDRFLIAAGINQILEDYLHRDSLGLRQAGDLLTRNPSSAGLVCAKVLGELSRSLRVLRSRSYERRIGRWQAQVAGLVEGFAESSVEREELARQAGRPRDKQALIDMERAPTRLRGTIVRLPACFVTFDQQPGDCGEIARDFANRWPDRQKPLAIVGVRTSGSYLAPLYASYLRRQGFKDVTVFTWRPGQQWLPHEVRQLRRLANAKALALLTDDPPTSGTALSKAASAIQALGFPKQSIILLLQLFESQSRWAWPMTLNRYESVRLPPSRWAIQRRLDNQAVGETLTDLLVGRKLKLKRADRSIAEVEVGQVNGVKRLPLAEKIDSRIRRSARRHVAALYRVELTDRVTGEQFAHHVYAKGIGLGYFGDSSISIAERLGRHVPEVYGAADGLMFRSWLPDEGRLTGGSQDQIARAARGAAEYVAFRQRALPVPQDLSPRLTGRDALWEQMAQLLSAAFGRGAPLAKTLLRTRFRRLVPSRAPSVVDGSMSPHQWFFEGPDRFVKVDFDENVFWRATPACYEAAFDLASAAVEFQAKVNRDAGSSITQHFRGDYRAAGGEWIDDERWVIYQLLHLRKCRQRFLHDYGLWEGARSLESPATALEPDATEFAETRRGVLQAFGALERDMSRVLAGYLGDLFLADITPPKAGPVWAIDIDGVLETGGLSFPATTPAGLLALRALLRHGYRVVLASGRSIGEIRDRCHAYRMAGGIGEYGAAVYDRSSGVAKSLLNDQQREAISRLRQTALQAEGIWVDPAFESSVRTYQVVAGQRSGLNEETISKLLASSSTTGIRAIRGRSQTDFTVPDIDKGTGLEVLTRGFEPTVSMGGKPLAAAIGDTEHDVPMMELAELAFAPANADHVVQRQSSEGSVSITKNRHQAGLRDAVSTVLGHRPGDCDTCRPPKLSRNAAFLVNMLAAQDVGSAGKLIHLLKLVRGDRR